jgi:penicillin-binding protein 1A
MSASNNVLNGRAKNRILRRFLIVFWSAILGGMALFALLLLMISWGVFGRLPDPTELENPVSLLASSVYDSNGEELGTFFKENRSNVRYDDISPHVIDALIATEDVRFLNHAGVDRKSLLRVAFKTIFLGQGGSGGGSTITQQLAKNLFPRRSNLSKPALAVRKLKEWVLAVRLEKLYTKEEILTMYLNTVEFINNAFGIKTASRVYFNTTPDSLTIEQGAMLVGMVKNPSLYNPIRFPDTTLHRRNVVLYQMVKYDKLSLAEFDSLRLLPLELQYQPVDHNIGPAPYAREYIRTAFTATLPERENYSSRAAFNAAQADWNKRVEEDPLYGFLERYRAPDGSKYDIYKDGLRIYTTINGRMQDYAEQAVTEHLTEWQRVFDDHWKNYSKDPWNWDRWNPDRYKPDFMERAMKNTDRYRRLKKSGASQDSIERSFNTRVRMTVFSWRGGPDREVDTMMTPLDSIRHFKFFLQAGFMAVDPVTGHVLAWVGGIDHRYFQVDHVKQSKRQVGSAFKPFVYTKAVEDLHYSPCMKFPNTPYTIKAGGGAPPWTPKNSSSYKDGEMVELQDALAHSINRITARLMHDVGPANVVNLLKEMGITDSIYPHHSLALGTHDLSVFQMTGAYTAYVNRGIYTRPMIVTKVEDKYGNVIADFSIPVQRQVFDWQISYVMLNFLLKVKQLGTASRLARYGFGDIDMGGKTGTTQGNTDGWFMGVTPQLVCGTWVGCEDPVISFRSTAYGQGAAMALPIYALFMQKVYKDPKLGYDRSLKFDRPVKDLTIELDCSRYRQKQFSPYDSLEISSIGWK